MKSGILIAVGCFTVMTVYCETTLWNKIAELSEYNSPQGNTRLEKYLKDLDGGEMLQAARECCEQFEAIAPRERWEDVVLPVSVALAYYGDGKRKISDQDLKQIMDCIVSAEEGELFRETMLRYVRQMYWVNLTVHQRKSCREQFLAVCTDELTPNGLRILSSSELVLAISEDQRSIVNSDKQIRASKVDGVGRKDRIDLVRNGSLQLETDTLIKLEAIDSEIVELASVIEGLLGTLPEKSRDRAWMEKSIKHLSELPEVPQRAVEPAGGVE